VPLEGELHAALIGAEILVPEGSAAREKMIWQRRVDAWRERAARGYVLMDGLLHPYHLGALRRYFRERIRRGHFPLGDGQSARRYAKHNDPVAQFFHAELTDVVSRVTGVAVKPSYVYFASYEEGADLFFHVDREQCEFSLTMCIDASPEPARESAWPIHLATEGGIVSIAQSIGDALLYRGRTIPHYRDALPRGHTYSALFFHYVPKAYLGPLD
jgi:hypothetical protein